MNPIQPVTNSHREINVVEPVSPAFERVKLMLFRPFDLGKWFVIGFCAWLAFLGEGGGAGFHGPGGGQGGSGEDLRQAFAHARDFVLSNLGWLVPLVAAVAILGLAILLLVLWLNSRGKFMFLHCVALNKAEVSLPWSQFAPQGNSLFWFRLILGFAGMILTLPLLVIICVLIVKMVLRGEPDPGGIVTSVGLGLAFFLVAIVFCIIKKFTVDFVVPIMRLRQSKCLAAWKEFYGLLSSHPGQFVLYLLFQIVLSIAIGMVVMGVLVMTCCCCCLMLLPYISTVLLLPVLVFKRAYPLYFLAQFGPEYDVFPPPPPAQPSPGLPYMPVVPPVM